MRIPSLATTCIRHSSEFDGVAVGPTETWASDCGHAARSTNAAHRQGHQVRAAPALRLRKTGGLVKSTFCGCILLRKQPIIRTPSVNPWRVYPSQKDQPDTDPYDDPLAAVHRHNATTNPALTDAREADCVRSCGYAVVGGRCSDAGGGFGASNSASVRSLFTICSTVTDLRMRNMQTVNQTKAPRVPSENIADQ